MGKVGGGGEGMEVRLDLRRRAWDSENWEGKQRVVCSTGGEAGGVSVSWLCLGHFQSVEGNVQEKGRSQCVG